MDNSSMCITFRNLFNRDVQSCSDILYRLVIFGDDSNTFGDGFGSDGMITSDHDDFDTSTSAFAHSIWNGSARRIDHTHQSNKTQIIQWEIRFRIRLSFWVEIETNWELISRQIVMTETKYTFTESS